MHNRMTEGSPLKLILMFAMPVLLGNVFQQFYNMADTMMVGRILGVDALAAMGATASVSGLVLGLNIGLAPFFTFFSTLRSQNRKSSWCFPSWL